MAVSPSHPSEDGDTLVPEGTRASSESLLSVRGLRAGYGAMTVVPDLDLEVADGEIVGVLGANGMGKSTLMKTLAGVLPVRGGKIHFDGMSVGAWPAYRRARGGVGYVQQGRGILPNLSVQENLSMGWTAATSETESQAMARVLALFPRLEVLLDRKGGALSGGEQQLLALARAMMARPLLLLLDEPTEGIQPSIIAEMAVTLARLRDSQGLAVLVAEQNLDFILDCADRVLILEKGVITGRMSHEDLRSPGAVEAIAGLGAARSTTHQTTSQSSSIARTRAPIPAAPATPYTSHRSGPPMPDAREHGVVAAQPAASHSPLELPMIIRRPSFQQIRDVVANLHMNMSDQEVGDYFDQLEGFLQAYNRVASLPEVMPEVRYPRTPGYRPSASENPLNAWYVKTDIRGAASGPLAGRRVVLKDNICLAGVPMMNGSSTLEGYVPDLDATVVTRILDAGGTIAGKAHCEHFCLSAGSHTNSAGPVHNPWKMGYGAGGSSSGCGALVGAGEVELAVGGDQGGSIRIPSSFCGLYGMKPTHGLVPYTGIFPIESTIDHAGPMTKSVADNALLLEVLAGADGLDPRQMAPRVEKYTAALGQGARGLRIGVLKEGFGWPQSEQAVDDKVRQAAKQFARLGARVEEVSVPMHLDGSAIWTPIALEGLMAQMMHGNSMGFNWKGLYTTSLLDRHAAWRSRANELSPSLKVSMFAGEYFLRQYGGRFYAKAQNLGRSLTAAYDRALQEYDMLLMPTLTNKARPMPPAGSPLSLVLQRAFEHIANTAPFDVTGHPAMSLPCGLSDGLPIGVMLVGKHWDERTVYQAAHAYEQSGDWRTF